jgi:hypothetical protein
VTAAPDYTCEPTAVDSALAFLDQTLAELSSGAPAVLDGADADAAVRLLASLRLHRQALASIEAYAETAVGRLLNKGQHKVAGYQVTVHSAGRWTEWRHDDVAFAVCRDIAVDPASGEVVPEVMQIINQVRSRLMNCARPEWRLTQLANAGVDPGDYAKWVKGRRTVQLIEDVTP